MGQFAPWQWCQIYGFTFQFIFFNVTEFCGSFFIGISKKWDTRRDILGGS